MKKIPGDVQVIQALSSAEKRIEALIKRINRQAGSCLAKGDYAGSDILVKLAKAVQEYRTEYSVIRSKWQDIMRSPSKHESEVRTETLPQWEYYRPILKVLMDLGGEASRQEIIDAIKPLISEFVKSGDLKPTKKGLPRWHVMIMRARKPMIKEGFLDPQKKGFWRITPVGRNVVLNSAKDNSKT